MNSDPIGESLMAVAEALEAAGLRYMVVGAVATFVHGEPRTTRDIDIAVDASQVGGPGVRDALEDARLSTTGIEQTEFGRRTWVTSTPFHVEVFLTGGHELHEREFSRAGHHDFGVGRELPVISAEDLVLRKLVNLRLRRSENHIQDVATILAKRGPGLDATYIRQHAGVHRVGKAFERFWKEARRNRRDS